MPAQVHLTDTPIFDLVIFGGRVIDPANKVDDLLDVPTDSLLSLQVLLNGRCLTLKWRTALVCDRWSSITHSRGAGGGQRWSDRGCGEGFA